MIWEYLVISLVTSDDEEKIFNGLGGKGWELAAAEGDRRYIFKRRKKKRTRQLRSSRGAR
jgi:hypothetical protein